MIGNLPNIFMEHDLNILMIFGIIEKCIILTHTMYCWLNIAVLLMTASVLQGHINKSAVPHQGFGVIDV